MKKEKCPFQDLNNDYCCNIALNEKESFKNCYKCAVDMYFQIGRYIKKLINEKEKGEKND